VTETLSLFTQFGPGIAVMVLLILLLVRQRDKVGAAVDDSTVAWIKSLEERVARGETGLREEREKNDRYRAAREKRDAVHRRWDSDLLRVALAGGDVAGIGDPPSLTPDPSEYELAPQEAR
jgi:hypothetical protein